MSIGIRVAKIRLLDTRQSFRLGAEHRLEPDEWPELAKHRFCLPQTEPVDHLIASAPYVRNPRIDYLDSSTIEIREETSASPNDDRIISAPREKCLGTSTARGNLRLPHNSIRSPSSATSTPLNARRGRRNDGNAPHDPPLSSADSKHALLQLSHSSGSVGRIRRISPRSDVFRSLQS